MKQFLFKLKWAFKLVRSQDFIISTDNESTVCVLIDSPFLNTKPSVEKQRANLKSHKKRLTLMLAELDAEIKKYGGAKGGFKV